MVELLERLTDQLVTLNAALPLEKSKKAVDFSDSSFPALPMSNQGQKLKNWNPVVHTRQVTERFEIPANMLVRQQLGKQASASKVCKDVMTMFKTKIEYSTNQKSQSLTLLVSGAPDAVAKSKTSLVNMLTVKITEVMKIPQMVRPALVGKQGVNLRNLETLSGTSIQLPRYQDTDNSELDDLEVTITGSKEAIELAKSFIEELVVEKVIMI